MGLGFARYTLVYVLLLSQLAEWHGLVQCASRRKARAAAAKAKGQSTDTDTRLDETRIASEVQGAQANCLKEKSLAPLLKTGETLLASGRQGEHIATSYTTLYS